MPAESGGMHSMHLQRPSMAATRIGLTVLETIAITALMGSIDLLWAYDILAVNTGMSA